MAATRHQLLARLHCIRKEMGWAEDTYRDILQARTGKRSAADLTGPELARVVAALGVQKPKGGFKRTNEWAFIDKAAEGNRPLLRKVCAVCIDMHVGKAYAEGVAKRQHGVERRLEMMSYTELWHLVGALERTRKFKANGTPPEGGIPQGDFQRGIGQDGRTA
ncbi:MAG: regulatory protein GemA [Rhodocyclaceae bacterium]|nr:regulatory protein GemA [Rhodocyclaceae bacterium]